MNTKKYAVVTGGSSGIGFEIACRLAKRKYHLILVARIKKKLQRSAEVIGHKYGVNVHCFCLDLRDTSGLEKLKEDLEIFGENVEILVNNAGIGLGGEFGSEDLKTDLKLIDLNIRALVSMTHFYISKFKQKRAGYILNIASLAGFQPGPYYANYYATKSYVLSFTEAIAFEAKKYGVHCSTLCPGTTNTNFHARAGTNSTRLSKGLFSIIDSAERVSKIGVKGLFAGRRVIIPGILNNLLAFSVRLIPRSCVTAITSWINQ